MDDILSPEDGCRRLDELETRGRKVLCYLSRRMGALLPLTTGPVVFKIFTINNRCITGRISSEFPQWVLTNYA